MLSQEQTNRRKRPMPFAWCKACKLNVDPGEWLRSKCDTCGSTELSNADRRERREGKEIVINRRVGWVPGRDRFDDRRKVQRRQGERRIHNPELHRDAFEGGDTRIADRRAQAAPASTPDLSERGMPEDRASFQLQTLQEWRGEVAIPDTPAPTDIYRDDHGTIRCGKCNLRPHNCICDRNPAPSIPDRGEPRTVIAAWCMECGMIQGGVHDERCSMPDRQKWYHSPLHQFFAEQGEWSQATFGTDQQRGPIGPLKHLAKEAAEAQENPRDIIELADCLFLVFDATRRAGFTLDDLTSAAFRKLAINKAREWPKFDPTKIEEAIEHARAVPSPAETPAKEKP